MHSQLAGKRPFLLFLAFLLIPFWGSAQGADAPFRIRTIVIDAGHGGHDPGNLGTGRYKTREKDIALDVALRVGGYIQTQFPEIKVIYTRDKDVFIGLNERADVANKIKADLFLSIHCNAAANSSAYGVETYALGLHKNQENLEVAMKENSAIYLEEDYKTKYEGFDPNSPESIIALTIMQSAFLQQSLAIAKYVQDQFKNRVGRRDRGVKQAGFLVLRRTTMPSILIELGFLTNSSEEDFLNSENGKAYMSSAIFRGFKEYKEMVEDPLPEGYVEPAPKTEVAEAKPLEEAKKQAAELEKARKDSIKKADEQARLKAVADSLEQAKQKLIDEKKKREAELAKKEELKQKAEAEKQARLKAEADSLEQVKREKLAEMERKKRELEEQKVKELAAQKAREDSLKQIEVEKAKKELESKQNAKEWLEEIKEAKEEELEEAKRKAATESEKERLEAIKREKEKELEEARKKQEAEAMHQRVDSLAAIKLVREQARIDSIARIQASAEKAKNDSIAKLEAAEQARKDSIAAVIAAEQAKKEAMKQAEEEKARQAARQKAQQDSVAAVRKKEAKDLQVTIDDKKAATPEEAELLFLQLRKKQLEQRIAELKGQNVETVTKEVIEERATQKPKPENPVSQTVVPGLIFRVQVVTSAKPLSATDPQFRGQQVWQYEQGGLYKYTVGTTQDFEEITKLQTDLRNLGFKGAFVVAFKDGERIKVSEAREMLSK
ncbi:MAG: hypothetical protein GC178_02570 [Flavobacteriales bacterium]|nr:hypothetical protein [Flavobacteriales bacterium]